MGNKEKELKTLSEFDFTKLSAAERKAVLFMRELKAFERIEIKLIGQNHNIISVIKQNTLREDFPIEMD